MNRRQWIILLFIAFVIAIGSISAKPVYKRAKDWRAGTLGREALALFEGGKLDIADERFAAAAKMSINVPEVRLAAARITGSRQDSSSLDHWSAFLDSDMTAPEHFWEAGERALELGRLEVAKDFLARLKVRHSSAEAEWLRLAANVAFAMGEYDLAWSNALQQMRLRPTDSEAKLLLAYIGLRSENAERRNECIEALSILAKGTDRTSLSALAILGTVVKESNLNLKSIGARLKAHPLASPFHQALGAELQDSILLAESDARFASLDMSAAVPTERHGAATWFNARGRHKVALRILPRSLAITRQDFLLTHLDALAGSGDWAGVQEILDDRDIPIDETLRHLYLSRVYEEQGRVNESESSWQLCLRSIESRKHLLGYVLYYAESQNWNERAKVIAKKLLSDPRTATAGAEVLIRLVRSDRDTRALRSALQQGLAALPMSIEIQNDLAYTNLLLNENINECAAKAAELAAANERLLATRITYALALLRLSKPQGAMKLFDGLRIPWAQAMPHHRAVYAAILKANGREEEFQEIIKTLNPSQLLKEEVSLTGLPVQ